MCVHLQVRDLNREDLIILGLEWTINDAELRKYFEQYGEVSSAEVSESMNIEFTCIDRYKRITWAVYWQEHKVAVQPKAAQFFLRKSLAALCVCICLALSFMYIHVLLVYLLASQVCEVLLWFLCTPLQVKKDHETGKSRGFGFVRYFDPSVQDKVQSMQHNIKGRRIDIKHPRKVGATIHVHVCTYCRQICICIHVWQVTFPKKNELPHVWSTNSSTMSTCLLLSFFLLISH